MPDTTDSLSEGTRIGDHFVVRAKLGGGGMGEVYLAENLNVQGKRYAVKVLRRALSTDERFVDMLRDEAAKQAKLEHDNVVGMYDFFQWHDHFCLVQNYIRGQTVSDLLAEHPDGLDADTTLSLMLGILAGLDHAHQTGILHCDIKPANVIVDNEGRPHVIDFGIARDIGAAPLGLLGGAGTLEYMSPEQVAPPYDVDHRTDVYSAGVLMYQMLTCRLPFGFTDAGTGAADPQTGPSTRAPDVRTLRRNIPEPLARIIATALHPDRTQRFQGCAEFANAIKAFRRQQQWRRTWLPGIAAAAVIAVFGVLALQEWRQRATEQVAAQQAANDARALELERQREVVIAQELHNAAAALNQMCFEAVRSTAAEGHLALARRNFQDDPAATATIVPEFERKLQALRDSAKKQVALYLGLIEQLGQKDDQQVSGALARLVVSDPIVATFADVLSTDSRAMRSGSGAPVPDALLARCTNSPAPAKS